MEYDDDNWFMGDGSGPTFSWWDGDACPRCRSGETIILRHGYDLTSAYEMFVVTDPFIGVHTREFQWVKVRVYEVPRGARFVSVFVESRAANLNNGHVWWHVQGYVEELPSDNMEFICRDCGEPWVGPLRPI